MTPYGDIALGQRRLGWWLVGWQHQAIPWTTFDLSLVNSSTIYLNACPRQVTQSPIARTTLNIRANFDPDLCWQTMDCCQTARCMILKKTQTRMTYLPKLFQWSNVTISKVSNPGFCHVNWTRMAGSIMANFISGQAASLGHNELIISPVFTINHSLINIGIPYSYLWDAHGRIIPLE